MRALIAGIAAAVALTATPAFAVTNLVTNGSFNATGGSRQLSDSNGNQQLSGWTNDNGGYNFIITGDATVTPNSNTQTGILTNQYGYIALWGKNNANGDAVAANNGLFESQASHGSYIAADGAFGVSKIYQLITGLTVGQTYSVSFDWAGAQQQGYDGATTEGWGVSLSTTLGNAVYTQTGNISDVSHGFTGWQTSTMTFTATASSEYLSFMANGTPSGVPPFSLLDNVSMVASGAVPEPATWGMMILGFGFVGFSMRRRGSATLPA